MKQKKYLIVKLYSPENKIFYVRHHKDVGFMITPVIMYATQFADNLETIEALQSSIVGRRLTEGYYAQVVNITEEIVSVIGGKKP